MAKRSAAKQKTVTKKPASRKDESQTALSVVEQAIGGKLKESTTNRPRGTTATGR